ncbi:hypothetical protein P3S68_008631 [Capsicum galapagoense]
MKLDCKDEAACAYVTAADCYKKIKNSRGRVLLFLDIGRLNKARGYYEEIAKLYEQENDMEQVMIYYQKTADLFQSMDLISSANRRILSYSRKDEWRTPILLKLKEALMAKELK